MTKTRVFLVEDHPVMRATLTEYLSLVKDLHLLGTAPHGEAALDALAADRPDLVLIDVSLPGMSGLDLTERIRDRWPDVHCVILSGHAQPSHVDRALKAGARGYILKGNPYEIAGAIRDVMEGGTYVSDSLR